jgi:hypothetical protein
MSAGGWIPPPAFAKLAIVIVGSYTASDQPAAEQFFIFFCISVFALYERKNRNTDTLLPQATRR